MATVQQVVETQMKVIDLSTGPLLKVSAQADKTADALGRATKAAAGGGSRLGGVFDTLASTLSNLGGLGLVVGSGLSFHAALETTDKYMENVKQITELTGEAAGATDFMFSAARRSGVAYDSMQRTMFQLSRRGSMLEQTMANAAGKVPGMEKKFARLGVVMDKGPVKAMETMAAAAKKGLVGAGELQSQFRIPAKDANDMLKFLKTMDPAKLAEARKGGGGFLTNKDIDAYDRMQEAQHRIADSWNRIKVTVIKNLYPIAAQMAEKFADKMESILPVVQNIFGFISDHMDHIVNAAKVFVGLMTAKKMMAWSETLAGGQGLVAAGKGLVTSLTNAVPLLEKMGLAAAQSTMGAAAAGAKAAGMSVSPTLLANLGGLSASLTVLGTVLAALAVVAATVYLGFRAVQKNLHGIGDKISEVIGRITARFELVWQQLTALGSAVANLIGGEGSLGDLVGYIAALSFDAVLEGFDLVMHLILTTTYMLEDFGQMLGLVWKTYLAEPAMAAFTAIKDGISAYIDWNVQAFKNLIDMLKPILKVLDIDISSDFKNPLAGILDPVLAPWKALGENFQKNWKRADANTRVQQRSDALERAANKTDKNVEKTSGPPNYDFRGSRFDITQNFAEGFDPDRIAVAFSNDLSSLGELRSQSGYTPIMAG